MSTPIVLAGLLLCGCTALLNPPTARYSTVVADPHRDEAKAIADTHRGDRLLRKGWWSQAEQALQDALIADVTYGPAHNSLGKLYYEQRKFYLAAWEFEYAHKLMPDRPEPLNNLGMVYEAVDRHDQAIEHYMMAYRIEPKNAEFIGNLARAHLKQDDHSPEARALLSDLLLYDTRPDWVGWAREQLAVAKLPTTPYSSQNTLPLGAPAPTEPMPPGNILIVPAPADDGQLDLFDSLNVLPSAPDLSDNPHRTGT